MLMTLACKICLPRMSRIVSPVAASRNKRRRQIPGSEHRNRTANGSGDAHFNTSLPRENVFKRHSSKGEREIDIYTSIESLWFVVRQPISCRFRAREVAVAVELGGDSSAVLSLHRCRVAGRRRETSTRKNISTLLAPCLDYG